MAETASGGGRAAGIPARGGNSVADKLAASRFMKACRGEQVDRTPIWLMRQAGRYMPEYREIRSKTTFLGLCQTPELAAQVTLDAQRILGVDAAILFADLLPILIPMGFGLDYLEGEGPKIFNPVREAGDVDRVVVCDPRQTQTFVGEAIRIIRRELPADVPLIGFCGAPFTLAAYACEGGGSRNYIHVKKLMLGDPGAFRELLTKMVDVTSVYLNMQVDAGVQAVQIFDSWVGALSPRDYRRHVLPHVTRLVQSVKGRVPVILFGVGASSLLPDMAGTGADVIGIDWHTPLAETWQRLGVKSVQGNLDPVALFAGREAILDQARAILDEVANRPGHIFNLGHGILPNTPVDDVKALVQFVQEHSAR